MWLFLLILAIGCLPLILTLLLRRRMATRARSRLHQAIAASERRQMEQIVARARAPDTGSSLSSLGFIGDVNCPYNAHSPYLRCAINPSGPCETCPHYESGKRSSPPSPSKYSP